MSYVCDVTLNGQSETINEYLIGSEVFDRGADYSPSEDAVVRRQAHSLRAKLDSYYANEGRANPVRIQLPVGQYVPIFERREESNGVEPTPSTVATLPESSRAKNGRLVAFGAIAATALSIGWMLGAWTSSEAGPVVSPNVKAIWQPWFDDPRGAVLCFANSTVAVIHHVPDASLEDRHPEHFRPSAKADQAFRKSFSIEPGGYLYFRPSNIKTSIAESIGAVALARFFGRHGIELNATQSRLINWEDLRERNFVILGHNESNPWVDSLLRDQPFALGNSQGVRRFIVNRSPIEGEAERFEKEGGGGGEGQAMTEYALISMLPGVAGSNRLLLISGLDGQATQLATEYLTEPEFLSDLSQRLRSRQPDHAGEWYFQAVVRASVRDRVPTRGEIVAVRVLAESEDASETAADSNSRLRGS